MSALEVPRQSRTPLSRRVVCWGHVDWIIIDEDNDIRVDRAAVRRHEAQEAAGGNTTPQLQQTDDEVIMEDCEDGDGSEDKGMMKRCAATVNQWPLRSTCPKN